MNHIYRIIWNHATACYQAVTESAKGQGKHSGKSTTVVHSGHSGGYSAFMKLSATTIAAALCIVSLKSFVSSAGRQVTAGSAGSTNTAINLNTMCDFVFTNQSMFIKFQ